MAITMQRTLHRAAILHFLNDPYTHGDAAIQYIVDGALLIENGHVVRVAEAEILLRDCNDIPVITHDNAVLVPGFVDTHVHYPQADIIASTAHSLLDWLDTRAYPAEIAFSDSTHCSAMSAYFLDELMRHGTTSALVFATVHPQSADAFFAESARRRLRMACGKVLMDRNAPTALLDTAETAYTDSRTLIEKWHKHDRLTYAVTPRFALTSSAEQLAGAGQLLRDYSDVLLHTHLAENKSELQSVAKNHPTAKHYLDVYHQHGLVCNRSVFAHGIHLCDDEWALLSANKSAISFCPTSNFILGSGLFNATCAQQKKVAVALGSDIGGGSSFSLFRVMDEAYKCARLRGDTLSPARLWYWATLGGAQALHMDHAIGNFTQGKEADFLVLKPHSIPLLQRRFSQVQSIDEKMLLMMMLGDERLIGDVYIMGERVNRQTTSNN